MKIKTLLLKTALTAFVKAAMAFVVFFMTIAVTQTMGAEQAGLFLLAVAILGAGSVFFRLGLDDVVLRLLSTNKGHDTSKQIMSTGLLWIILVSSPISLLVSFYSYEIATLVFSKPDFAPILEVSVLALPVMALTMLLAVGFQSFHRVIVTTFFQNLGHISLFLILFTIYQLFIPTSINATNAMSLYLLSAMLVLLIAAYMWHKQVNGHWNKPAIVNPVMWRASSNLWMATSMMLAVQWSGVLIAGAFVSSSEIAHLSAAQRTASLTSFVLMVVNMVVAPRYAQLWSEGKLADIKQLAKWSTRGMILLALPIVMLMILFSTAIMSIFGEGFEQSAILLIIISAGQFINVASGSVGYLLNMSGHEKDFRRVTFFAGPLTIILSYILIQQYGVLGAAIATAVGLAVQNIGALFMVRKRLGFWPLG